VAIPTFGSRNTGTSEGKNEAPEVIGGGYTDGIDRQYVNEAEDQRFKNVIAALRQAVQEIPELAQMQDNLLLEPTPDGLLIQILDRVKVRMFEGNTDKLTERGEHLIAIIASIASPLKNKISLTGYTDRWEPPAEEAGRKWEISGNRAENARRTLIGFGIGKRRFFRVIGRADREPLSSSAPKSIRNNRISILLLRNNHPDLVEATGAAEPKG
jgi:chemotaxis protein MotB